MWPIEPKTCTIWPYQQKEKKKTSLTLVLDLKLEINQMFINNRMHSQIVVCLYSEIVYRNGMHRLLATTHVSQTDAKNKEPDIKKPFIIRVHL